MTNNDQQLKAMGEIKSNSQDNSKIKCRSICCNAEVHTEGDNSHLGGTYYYVCETCNEATDVIGPHEPTETEGQELHVNSDTHEPQDVSNLGEKVDVKDNSTMEWRVKNELLNLKAEIVSKYITSKEHIFEQEINRSTECIRQLIQSARADLIKDIRSFVDNHLESCDGGSNNHVESAYLWSYLDDLIDKQPSQGEEGQG